MDLGLQLTDIYSPLLHDLEHSLKGPFVSDAHLLLILVEHKLLALLVDCVVGEVHADIIDVVLVRRDVGLSGEPAQSLPEDEHAQRVNSCHQHVYSQVELQPVDQVGAAEVALHHTVLLRIDVLQLASEEDALALR